jgi:sugar/nucleoside kinase (ribokinase family)
MRSVKKSFKGKKPDSGTNTNVSDMVVVGELNMDIILGRVNNLPMIGKERIAESMAVTLGSSSAILACNAAALGMNVTFVGRIGNDLFGEQIRKTLTRRGLDISCILTSDKVQTGLTFIYTHGNDRGMITYPGAMEDLTIKDIDWTVVEKSAHLHMSSYYLQKGIKPDCSELFRKAKSLGLSTSLDTNWDPDETWGDEIYGVLEYVDVFLPNDAEAKLISKKDCIDEALAFLSSFGCVVVATCGSQGVIAQAGDTVYHASAVNVKPVDAVGAGDSFNSGFLKNYIAGMALEACLELGIITGAYSTQMAGGTAAFEDMAAFRMFQEKAKKQIRITTTTHNPDRVSPSP